MEGRLARYGEPMRHCWDWLLNDACISWGSVADWFAAVGTVGALVFAALTYYFAQAAKRRDQADQVFFNVGHPEDDRTLIEISVFNPSGQRITNPFFTTTSRWFIRSRAFLRMKKSFVEPSWPEKKHERGKGKGNPDPTKEPDSVRVFNGRTYWTNDRGYTRIDAPSMRDTRAHASVVFKDLRGRFWIRHFTHEKPIRLRRKFAESITPDTVQPLSPPAP